jgi:hypothetical protein
MNYIHPGKISCAYCKSSKVHKNGIRLAKKGEMQEWHCQHCRKYFRTPVEDPHSSLMIPEDVEPGKILHFKLPGYTKISIDDKDWFLVSGHGKGGGKNGDLELDKMSAVYSDGDAFFLGHNHQLYAKPIDSLRVDGDEERLHRRWYCRGGSFLKYAEYARYSFFPMIRTGWVTMEFMEDKIKAWTN